MLAIGITCVLIGWRAQIGEKVESSERCKEIESTHLQSNSLELTSGGALLMCDDGTLITPPARQQDEEAWRLRTTTVWKNPLVKVCMIPNEFSQLENEPWHNVIGILAPFANDELNYAISLRRDGKLVIKKEVTDYTTLSPYVPLFNRIPTTTISIAMVASVIHDSNGGATIRAWVDVGSCNVNTTGTPMVQMYDSELPHIMDGAIEVRTDFLSHQILEWSGCESAQNGTQCADEETRFIPLR